MPLIAKVLIYPFQLKMSKRFKICSFFTKSIEARKVYKSFGQNLTCSQWRQKQVFFQEVAFSTPPPPRCIFHSHPQSFSTPLSLYSHFSLLPVGSSHVLVLKSHSFVLPDNIDKIKYIAWDE